MFRRRSIGISSPVASQQNKPVAIATAAGRSALAIPRWPTFGKIAPDTLPGLAAQRPADCRALRPHHSAQHHLLCLSRLAGAKINALAETHFGARSAQPPAHPARQSEQNPAIVLDQ